VKSSGLDKPDRAAFYAPFARRTFPWLQGSSFVVRTNGGPELFARTIRQQLTAIDSQQPIYRIVPLDHIVSQSVAARRFDTGLIDLFAALAIALCAVGVYGTIVSRVAERAREIGVRMALGATRRGIRLMMVARACAPSASGIGLGIVLSIWTGRLLSTLLFGVPPFDPSTIAGAALLVLATGAAAACIPARRASSLDPLSVIRGE